ncbi:MAG TPA: helix-turn-helix transcriptional regulator, partial [Myxococcota bacterium]|nr:helix-turn-helix transcriptional regulator [Myxococcota bacterium]
MPTVIVPLFADKITLLVQARRNPKIKTMDDLRAFLGTKQDYWSRIVNGVRAVPDDMLAKICDIFQMAPKEMLDTDILEFGTRLNFTRRQISQITSTPLPGMDFESRIRDSTHIRRLYEVMGGYWESY